MKPLPELDNERWKDRLVLPIGIDDQGRYFPLSFDPMAPGGAVDPAQLNFRLSRVLDHQAQIHLTTGDLAEAKPLLEKAIEFEKSQKKIDHKCLAESYLILSDIDFEFLINLDHAEFNLQEAFFHAKELPEESNRALVSTILHRLGQISPQRRRVRLC